MMNYLVAKTDKQLGICLRVLYPIQSVSKVDIQKTEKDKMEYHVFVDVDDEEFNQIERRYKIMIS